MAFEKYLSISYLPYILVPVLLWILKKELSNLYTYLRGKLVSKLKSSVKGSDYSKISPEVIVKELNHYFKNEVEFYGILTGKELEIKYELLSANFEKAKKTSRYSEEKARIKEEGCVNEPHLILDGFTELSQDKLTFTCSISDFAHIRYLRNKKEKPQIVSAGAVIVNNEDNTLIVHKRSAKSATYPSYYHILGGAFLPKSKVFSTTYDTLLSDTVLRELREETNSKLTIPDTDLSQVKFISFSKELSTGFIQFEYLGLNAISSKDISGNWEGEITPIKFSEIEEILKTWEWVPSGKAHILAWLALGAPGCTYLKPKQAVKIYQSVLGIND